MSSSTDTETLNLLCSSGMKVSPACRKGGEKPGGMRNLVQFGSHLQSRFLTRLCRIAEFSTGTWRQQGQQEACWSCGDIVVGALTVLTDTSAITSVNSGVQNQPREVETAATADSLLCFALTLPREYLTTVCLGGRRTSTGSWRRRWLWRARPDASPSPARSRQTRPHRQTPAAPLTTRVKTGVSPVRKLAEIESLATR